MAQLVNVPGVGQLSFPDGMSQPDMAAAIQKNFPQIHNQTSQQPEDTSFIGGLAHQAGLAARLGVNAIAAAPAMLSDAVTGPINAALDLYDDARSPSLSEVVTGKQKGFRFQRAGAALNNVMDAVGVSQPQNAAERVVQDVGPAVGSAVGGIGAGKLLASSASPVVSAVGDMLAAGPGLQMTSAAAGAGASGVVREKGGGPGAQLVAGLAGSLAPVGVATALKAGGGTRQLYDAATKAHENGYVIPPVDLVPNSLEEVVGGIGGKIKTAQVASQRNQSVTNSLVKQALGLGEDQDLNLSTLAQLRSDAAQQYEPVASTGIVTPSASYSDAIDAAVAPYLNQQRSFPNRKLPALVDDILSLKTDQFDAGDALSTIRVLRNDADAAYRSGDGMAGKAYKSASQALEDAIDEHLVTTGAPSDLLDAYRGARQKIAQTFTVQRALNPTTGNVSAPKLASELARGKPLTGELQTVAQVAQAFPKSMQLLQQAPGSVSPLDAAVAVMKATAKNPLPLLTLGARPLARNLSLSNVEQSWAVGRSGPNVSDAAAGIPGALVGTTARAASDLRNNQRPLPVSSRPSIEDIGHAQTVEDAIKTAAAAVPSVAEIHRDMVQPSLPAPAGAELHAGRSAHIDGDSKVLQSVLKRAGIPCVPTKNGVLVGASHAQRALNLISELRKGSQD